MRYLLPALVGATTTVGGIFILGVCFNGISEAIDEMRDLDAAGAVTLGALAVVGALGGAAGAVVA